MKIIITESQLISAYWKFLNYLLGELTEYHSEKYPDTRYWKNDEYGVVLDLNKSGHLFIHHEIWYAFSNFFFLEYHETQQVMKNLLEQHLKLGGITPASGLYQDQASFEITPYIAFDDSLEGWNDI
jgi:hypothetical protein